mmetsp:Transcript_22389/g.55347  ORF Transcript_22389/g.55347 Transcript_22389/m.55347 type:complete len:219 (-) Transcript_22389:326-982(-)
MASAQDREPKVAASMTRMQRKSMANAREAVAASTAPAPAAGEPPSSPSLSSFSSIPLVPPPSTTPGREKHPAPSSQISLAAMSANRATDKIAPLHAIRSLRSSQPRTASSSSTSPSPPSSSTSPSLALPLSSAPTAAALSSPLICRRLSRAEATAASFWCCVSARCVTSRASVGASTSSLGRNLSARRLCRIFLSALCSARSAADWLCCVELISTVQS